jgi:hypothetical protein
VRAHEVDHLPDAERRGKADVLEHDADLLPSARAPRVPAEQRHRAGVGPPEAEEQGHGG